VAGEEVGHSEEEAGVLSQVAEEGLPRLGVVVGDCQRIAVRER